MAFTLVVTMAGAAGLNVAAERVAYRRLRRAPKLAPLITAVGLSFIYQQVGLIEAVNGSQAAQLGPDPATAASPSPA